MTTPERQLEDQLIEKLLWFLAKNKNAEAKRGVRERLGLENQLALAA